MKLDINRVDVWVAGIEDRPGGLTEKLGGLTQAGANLEFLLARRAPEQPGKAVVFAAPIKGAKQMKAAQELGFHKSTSLHGPRQARSESGTDSGPCRRRHQPAGLFGYGDW
jgi:hypothetical protein